MRRISEAQIQPFAVGLLLSDAPALGVRVARCL